MRIGEEGRRPSNLSRVWGPNQKATASWAAPHQFTDANRGAQFDATVEIVTTSSNSVCAGIRRHLAGEPQVAEHDADGTGRM